jgi:signal transduction histidine kinase
MRLKPSTWCLLIVWVLVIGSYALAALTLPAGPTLTAFGNMMQCLVPLFANFGLLLNAGSNNWRKNAFWMLLALGCTMWMAGQFLWTYYEVGLRQTVPNPFVGDVIFFLHTVPMIAALALRPQERHADRSLRFAYLDFLLLLSWWVYLYAFVVLPWQYVSPNEGLYGHSYNQLYTVENLLLLAGLGFLWLRTRGYWRGVYGHLYVAAFLYTLGALVINVNIDLGEYYTGSLYDVPLVASFMWFGTAGVVAFRNKLADGPEAAESPAVRGLRTYEGVWTTRLAILAVLSLPLMAAWTLEMDSAPQAVKNFRLVATFAAMVALTTMVFLRQQAVEKERLRLLNASQESLNNLKRLQTSFAQAERMAALGQLAAGAAHEINNPLTAILGYSELILADKGVSEKSRALSAKIQEQARRTKTLVTNLQSFARQLPVAKAFLDIGAVLRSAVQLRTLDLREKNIRIHFESESVLPGVRGDPNQLLQVFYNIINNAVDAMQVTRGGVLTVRAMREKNNVVLELSDTGLGVKDPDRVFDPYYTTKPLGEGNGLGLSICYGIVQEHGGRIYCFNRPEGGATFRIELPAVMAVMPTAATVPLSAPANAPVPGAVPEPAILPPQTNLQHSSATKVEPQPEASSEAKAQTQRVGSGAEKAATELPVPQPRPVGAN